MMSDGSIVEIERGPVSVPVKADDMLEKKRAEYGRMANEQVRVLKDREELVALRKRYEAEMERRS